MPTPFHLVNAFTIPSSPFSGNQAAVVLLGREHPREGDDEWKALLARDFNFSETSYLTEKEDGKWGLRWWTPSTEVVLCGHATLAAAATLFKLYPEKAELAFITRWSGQLTATREINTDQRDTSIKMAITLPGLQPEALAQIGSTSANDGGAASKAVTTARQALAEAAPSLSVESLRRDPFIFSWGKVESCIIELEDAVELERLKVDAKILSRIGQGLLILAQLVLSASSRGRLQIRSRVFAPGCGVDEDPVTGSAHAYLTSYYTSPTTFSRLPQTVTEGVRPEDLVLDAYQVSERGGRLECSLQQGGKVRVCGMADIWGQGELPV